MAAEIRVNFEELAAATQRLQLLPGSLGLATVANFNTPTVDRAYDKINGMWDEHRSEIDQRLDRLASILDAIRTSYLELECKLVDQLKPQPQSGGG